jgi:hypothetical protein
MHDGFDSLNRGDASLDSEDFAEGAAAEGNGGTPRRQRLRNGRSESADSGPLARGNLIRTKRLIEAAVRVWELKRGLRD